jgi:hypothetical protein
MFEIGFLILAFAFVGFILRLLVSAIPFFLVLNIVVNTSAGVTNTGVLGGLNFVLWDYCLSDITAL